MKHFVVGDATLSGALARKPAWWALTAVVVGLTGCSVGDVTVTGAPPPAKRADAGTDGVDPADFVVAVSQTLCDNLEPCCDGQSLPFDKGTCERTFAAGPAPEDIATWKPAALGRCLDALKTLVSSCFDLADLAAVQAACPETLLGKAPAPHGQEGDVCYGNCETYGIVSLCSSDNPPKLAPEGGSNPEPTQGTTVCYGADGLFCRISGDRCEKKHGVFEFCEFNRGCQDSWCDGTNHCAPLKSSGSVCADSAECRTGLFCDMPSGTSSGVCSAKKPDGATCRTDLDCESTFCGLPHVCENPLLLTITKTACLEKK